MPLSVNLYLGQTAGSSREEEELDAEDEEEVGRVMHLIGVALPITLKKGENLSEIDERFNKCVRNFLKADAQFHRNYDSTSTPGGERDKGVYVLVRVTTHIYTIRVLIFMLCL